MNVAFFRFSFPTGSNEEPVAGYATNIVYTVSDWPKVTRAQS